MKYNNEKTLPARTDTMTRGTKPKKQKETSANRAKQIEATVHFGPKLVSREILERQFGFLFRPNIIKSTRSSLNQTEWLTSASLLKIASVIVGLRIAIT